MHIIVSSVAAAATVDSFRIRVKCKVVFFDEIAKDFIIRSNHPTRV